MSWIRTIPYEKATGKLKKLYDRVKGPDYNVDNIMLAHGLRPHSMSGHMTLYKNVLHNTNNTLPKWFLECIGVYVSMLNTCDYCVQHHSKGLKKLLNNDKKLDEIIKNLQSETFCKIFDSKFAKALNYSKLLTLSPAALKKPHIELLQNNGFTDGEILEINQVVSYFNYANRTVLGLGVNLKGDIVGLSPNDSSDEDNWNHK